MGEERQFAAAQTTGPSPLFSFDDALVAAPRVLSKLGGAAGNFIRGFAGSKTVITNPSRLLTAGDRVPNATGKITSEILDESTIFYRAHGGESGPVGSFLAPSKPLSRSEAISGNSLPSGNTAEYVSTLRVQGGKRVQRSTAAGAFGQSGGNSQVEVLERAKIQVLKTEPLR